MLRVTVDLVPLGFEKAKRNLYTLEIGNVGPDGLTIDDDGKKHYSYRVRSRNELGIEVDHGVMVKGFDRDKPAYELISLITSKLNEQGFFKR